MAISAFRLQEIWLERKIPFLVALHLAFDVGIIYLLMHYHYSDRRAMENIGLPPRNEIIARTFSLEEGLLVQVALSKRTKL
jgi:hypothetical protein